MHLRWEIPHADPMVLQTLLLGFTIGLVAVIPPGPVALSLIEVGVQQGRRGGAWGGVGVAGGDTVVASVAAGLVLMGGALPDRFFAGAQVVSGIVLVVLGMLVAARPDVTRGLARSITRPGRAFFVITALTPSVFGAWLAMIAAMPFAQEPGPVAAFVTGGMVASLGYHLVLGAGAGGLGARLQPATLAWASRLGGSAMVVFGVWTLT